MKTVLMLLATIAAGCNPRPVACHATLGIVDSASKAAEVQHCRIDQVCCKYGEQRFGCGEVREPACVPQAPRPR